jgi:hypothetical protein
MIPYLVVNLVPKNMIEVIELEKHMDEEFEEEFDGNFEHEEFIHLSAFKILIAI